MSKLPSDPEPVFHLEVRVRVAARAPFFGPGPAQLLRCIRQCGSVQGACTQMGLSYSKGRAILRMIKQQSGRKAVTCRKGGVGGGQAVLTPDGEELLEQYTRYEQDVRAYAAQRFDRYFAPAEQEDDR